MDARCFGTGLNVIDPAYTNARRPWTEQDETAYYRDHAPAGRRWRGVAPLFVIGAFCMAATGFWLI